MFLLTKTVNKMSKLVQKLSFIGMIALLAGCSLTRDIGHTVTQTVSGSTLQTDCNTVRTIGCVSGVKTLFDDNFRGAIQAAAVTTDLSTLELRQKYCVSVQVPWRLGPTAMAYCPALIAEILGYPAVQPAPASGYVYPQSGNAKGKLNITIPTSQGGAERQLKNTLRKQTGIRIGN